MDPLRTAYRGYHIYLVGEASSWSFSAQPATHDFPILPRSTFPLYVSSEAALAEAKKRIDRLLAI